MCNTISESFAKGESSEVSAIVLTPFFLAIFAVSTISAVRPVNDIKTNKSPSFIIDTIIL